MDSRSFLQTGFVQWRRFEEGVERTAPQVKGVYAFRDPNQSISGGTSDIVYIGRANGAQHTLQHCLREYLHPGHLQRTKLRVKQSALEGLWEISWKETENAAELEGQLLRDFVRENGKRPRANRQTPNLRALAG